METIIFLKYPAADIRRIEKLIKERDSFVALLDGDFYSIAQHLISNEFEFTALLDRNVYTRITALLDERENDLSAVDLRWAAAILAFCQIADITLDYASSLQEYASHHGGAAACGAALDADNLAREADQDRSEGGAPRPEGGPSNGGGRCSPGVVPGHPPGD